MYMSLNISIITSPIYVSELKKLKGSEYLILIFPFYMFEL